ncbi:malonyl-CoA-acyl carrier protein transacylase beg [Arctopsyche grandis]|uniref:malonyl-CoA-acyl carrier protein transacylase beg n=1 Tax=Arctopsyche grandis TaxID=121162 RepID=UPI00406D8580
MGSVSRLLRIARLSSCSRACSGSARKESPLKGLIDDAASYKDAHIKTPWATQPYTYIPQKSSPDYTLEPNDSCIILFPGQGTQFLGMGEHLFKYPDVKELYDCASEIIDFDLKKIKTKAELDKYCQILIVVTSLAAVENLRDQRPSALPSCVATAGFSLGEITALIFSGAISLEEGLRVVNIRALAMEAASKDNPGGMLTVLYGPDAKLSDLCKDAIEYCIKNKVEYPVCSIANYLYPECKVISASTLALKFVEENGKKYGIRRTTRLNVAGPFHSVAMTNAVEPVRAALKYCRLNKPTIPVYSAVDNKCYTDQASIMRTLPKQIVRPVKWEQLMQSLYLRPKGSNFPRTFEIGPGRTLRSILRKINGPAWDNSFSIFE